MWALGAILFEILTLRPLVPRTNAAQMVAVTVAGVDADPSSDDLPPELASLCVRASATDPEERLASAAELAEGIERFLDGDRDARARRAKAEEHAAAAEAAAERGIAEDALEERQRAASEAARALAFDPENVGARGTLMRLLTTPPERVPPAAQRSYEAARTKVLRSFYRESLVMMALYTPLIFGAFLVELREVWSLYGMAALSVVFGATCVWAWRRAGPGDGVLFVLHLLISAAMLMLARITTPLIVLPLVSALNTLVTSAYSRGRRRWIFGLVGMMPVLVAGTLELTGVWPPTMRWESGRLILESAVLPFDSPNMIIAALLLSALPVMASTIVVGRVSDESDQVERDAHVQRWQLEQLVPKDG